MQGETGGALLRVFFCSAGSFSEYFPIRHDLYDKSLYMIRADFIHNLVNGFGATDIVKAFLEG